MMSKHGKICTSLFDEIRCINLKVIVPMVICIILHVSKDLKPIPILKALLSKFMNLLKEKI